MSIQTSLLSPQNHVILLEDFERQMEHMANEAIKNLCSSRSLTCELPNAVHLSIEKVRCSTKHRDLILAYIEAHDLPLSLLPIPASGIRMLDRFGVHFLSDIITLSCDDLRIHYAIPTITARRITKVLNLCLQYNTVPINTFANERLFPFTCLPKGSALEPICAAYRFMKKDNLLVISRFLNTSQKLVNLTAFDGVVGECGDRNLAVFATRTPASFLAIPQFGAARLDMCLKKQRELFKLILPWISSQLHGFTIQCSETTVGQYIKQVLTPKPMELPAIMRTEDMVSRLPACIPQAQIEQVFEKMAAEGSLKLSDRGWSLPLVPLMDDDLSACSKEERTQLEESFVHPSIRLQNITLSMHICRRAFEKAYTRHLEMFGLPPEGDLIVADFKKDKANLSRFASLRYSDLMYLLYKKTDLPGFERGFCGGLPDPCDVIASFASYSPKKRITPDHYPELIRIFTLLKPDAYLITKKNTELMETILRTLQKHAYLFLTPKGLTYREPKEDQRLFEHLFFTLPRKKFLSLVSFMNVHEVELKNAGIECIEDFLQLAQKRKQDLILSSDKRFFSLGSLKREEAAVLILENEGPQEKAHMEDKLLEYPLSQEPAKKNAVPIIELEGVLYLKDSFAYQRKLFSNLFTEPFYFHTDVVDIWRATAPGLMLPSKILIEAGGYLADQEWMVRRGYTMEDALKSYLKALGSFSKQDILRKAKRRQLPVSRVMHQMEEEGQLFSLNNDHYCTHAYLLSTSNGQERGWASFFQELDHMLPGVGQLFTLSSLCNHGLSLSSIPQNAAQALLAVHLLDMGGFLSLKIGETLVFYHDRNASHTEKAHGFSSQDNSRYERARWQTAVLQLGRATDQKIHAETLLSKFQNAGCSCSLDELAYVLRKQNVFFSINGLIYLNRKSAARASRSGV